MSHEISCIASLLSALLLLIPCHAPSPHLLMQAALHGEGLVQEALVELLLGLVHHDHSHTWIRQRGKASEAGGFKEGGVEREGEIARS